MLKTVDNVRKGFHIFFKANTVLTVIKVEQLSEVFLTPQWFAHIEGFQLMIGSYDGTNFFHFQTQMKSGIAQHAIQGAETALVNLVGWDHWPESQINEQWNTIILCSSIKHMPSCDMGLKETIPTFLFFFI